MTIAAATASQILRAQRMPPAEIRAVLSTEDPVLVRRLLELHLERLGEWLEEQRRLVGGSNPVWTPDAGPGRASRPEIAVSVGWGTREDETPGQNGSDEHRRATSALDIELG